MQALTGWIKELFVKEPACLACGDCCRQFSWHLKASARDIDRWRQLGRDDLLAGINDLGWIWVDPETKERLSLCPYLIETEDHKAHCGIHEIKPDICRDYPTYETYHQCLHGIQIKNILGGTILLPVFELLENVWDSPILPAAELLF